MIFPGHLSAGYLVAKAILATHPEISGVEASQLALIGTFFGFAPDLDLIYHFFKARSFKFNDEDTHRRYITHTPLFWVLVGFAVFIFTGNKIMSLIITLASLSHIFFDSFGSGHGLMYFWPFSKKTVSFLKVVDFNPQTANTAKYHFLLIKEYIRHTTFYLELILSISALYLILLR